MNQDKEVSSKGWWYIRFRMKWPEDREPLWHVDLFLTHTILAPVLKQYRNDILLWRFHRMAARDAEGHQFSFIFYASAETASVVNHAVKANAVLIKLMRSRVLVDVMYENTDNIIRPNIEDTSDPHWSPQIMKTWPWFIMGVCEMWLKLIHEISMSIPAEKKTSSVIKMLVYYQKIHEKMNTHWREEGGHSLLHHLNAIFGYETILVRDIRLTRF